MLSTTFCLTNYAETEKERIFNNTDFIKYVKNNIQKAVDMAIEYEGDNPKFKNKKINIKNLDFGVKKYEHELGYEYLFIYVYFNTYAHILPCFFESELKRMIKKYDFTFSPARVQRVGKRVFF